MRLLPLLACLILLAACRDDGQAQELSRLRADVTRLQAATELASHPAAAAAAPAGPELGAQMLELQLRHARLWQAGQGRNWLLVQFQLAELRESLDGVVELNGDHAALQPQRLAEILPQMMSPSLKAMQKAIDAGDGAGFDAAFDNVSRACTACHTAAEHGFLVIQRPQTPTLDNLKSTP